jgi:hypothetical protein
VTADVSARLAARVRDSLPALAVSFSQRLMDAAPEYNQIDASDFQDAGWPAFAVVIDGACVRLQTGRNPPALPDQLRAEAAASARNGLPWEVLSRSYHLTHQVLAEAIIAEVGGLGLRSTATSAVLTDATRACFEYFDDVISRAQEAYDEARERLFSGRQHNRLAAVRQLLDGVPVEESRLGYPITRRHLAVVASGADSSDIIGDAARALRAPSLVLPVGGTFLWAWLGLRADTAPADIRAAFRRSSYGWIALGSPADGRRGFVTSHRQAQAAASLCARRLVAAEGGVVAFDDVSLAAVALDNEPLARVFVEHELGGLLGADLRSRTLRRTLAAYARSGRSVPATATELGVAERTIRYRLQRIEDVLGTRMHRRITQLATALLLQEALERQREDNSAAPA